MEKNILGFRNMQEKLENECRLYDQIDVCFLHFCTKERPWGSFPLHWGEIMKKMQQTSICTHKGCFDYIYGGYKGKGKYYELPSKGIFFSNFLFSYVGHTTSWVL